MWLTFLHINPSVWCLGICLPTCLVLHAGKQRGAAFAHAAEDAGAELRAPSDRLGSVAASCPFPSWPPLGTGDHHNNIRLHRKASGICLLR